jgi:hypothetical protein
MVDTNELRGKLAEQIEHYKVHGPVGHKAGIFIRRHGQALLDELDRLRALEARVLAAPVGFVVGQSGPDFVSACTGAVVQMDNPESVKGKRVRLLPAGDGEGGGA